MDEPSKNTSDQEPRITGDTKVDTEVTTTKITVTEPTSASAAESDAEVVKIESADKPVVEPHPVVAQPEVTSISNATPTDAAKPPRSSAGMVVLQWLTYAFWGWTILSFVWLLFIVIATFMTTLDVSDTVPYAIAATLVLLPLSLVCDIFYGRHEPAKKTGAAMVVMVIHAVIFALFGIGMLISAALVIVQLSIDTDSGNTDLQTVWIITALISAAIYALTFLRTLNPSSKLRLAKVYPAVMAVVVGAFIVAGFIGPVAQARLTKDDALISSNLSSMYEAIDEYVQENNKLPLSFSDVELSQASKDIVARGLVEYKPEDSEVMTDSLYNGSMDVAPEDIEIGREYRFQLCTTYKKASSSMSYGDTSSVRGYETYVETYRHPAGNVCYKLKSEVYDRRS